MPFTDEQIVKLSPFSVIIMMTLIDGGGRYNLERAFRLLERLDAEPFATTSQLLRNQMDQLLGEVDFIADVMQKGQFEIIAPLARVRRVLDETYPEEAEGFCKELISLAKFAANFDDPDGRAVMTANEMEFEKLLKIMLLDEDPGAREEIAMIIEFFCLGTDLEDSE